MRSAKSFLGQGREVPSVWVIRESIMVETDVVDRVWLDIITGPAGKATE